MRIDAIQPTAVLVLETEDGIFYASLEKNGFTREFMQKLSSEPLTLDMQDNGGFEKKAGLPFDLPCKGEDIETAPGDLLLYEGNMIALCCKSVKRYAVKLACIGNTAKDGFAALSGKDSVKIRFYLEWSE